MWRKPSCFGKLLLWYLCLLPDQELCKQGCAGFLHFLPSFSPSLSSPFTSVSSETLTLSWGVSGRICAGQSLVLCARKPSCRDIKSTTRADTARATQIYCVFDFELIFSRCVFRNRLLLPSFSRSPPSLNSPTQDRNPEIKKLWPSWRGSINLSDLWH